jgi:hypothetical protein
VLLGADCSLLIPSLDSHYYYANFLTMFNLLLLLSLICAYPKIETTRDVFIEFETTKGIRSMLPSGTPVEMTDTRLSQWYELFEDKKSLGFVPADYVKVDSSGLTTTKETPLKARAEATIPGVKLLPKGKTYKFFTMLTSAEHRIKYKNQYAWLPSDTLKFIHDEIIEKNLFEAVPIGEIVKLKQEKINVSPALDKTMYIAASGVYLSYNGREWYRITRFQYDKHAIAVTTQGYLLVDNLISKDYGKTFQEFFPAYAFPYEDSYIKNIMTSAQENGAVYISFSAGSNPNLISLYVLGNSEAGWKRIYPTIEGAVITVPMEDTMTSVLKFVNLWLIRVQSQAKAKSTAVRGNLELEDISVQGIGRDRTATLVLKTGSQSNVKKYLTTLSLRYEAEKGWQITDEKWRHI